MKTQLWITPTKKQDFNHITEAMNYAKFHNISHYVVLLIDDSGYSLYDSLRARWLFPADLDRATQHVNSLLA